MSNYFSYSHFHCSGTRPSFITGYVAIIYARFHCTETRVIFITVYVAVITYSYFRFHLFEIRMIITNRYAAIITLVIPASISMRNVSFSSTDTYTLSLSEIYEIMIVSIKSNFLSHEGRRSNVQRPNGRAQKRPRAQTAAPQRPAPPPLASL